MSLYWVKEAEAEFHLLEPEEDEEPRKPMWNAHLHLDDAYTTFTYEELDQAFRGEPTTRRKLGKLGKRFCFDILLSMEGSTCITVDGDPVEYILQSHQNAELQLIVNLKFENGLTIRCKLDGSRFTPEIIYFRGRTEAHPNKLLVAKEPYRCRATVEVIDKAAFNFLENSDTGPFLKKLLKEKRFCDFAIIGENGAVIQCHKHFLATRSPVFDRMLSTNCIETTENRCKMDVSEAVVNAFLQFIYCSDLTEVFESPNGLLAVELMELGHKYDIQPLEESTKTLLLNRDAEWLDGDAGIKLFNYSTHKDGEEYQRLADKALRIVES